MSGQPMRPRRLYHGTNVVQQKTLFNRRIGDTLAPTRDTAKGDTLNYTYATPHTTLEIEA